MGRRLLGLGLVVLALTCSVRPAGAIRGAPAATELLTISTTPLGITDTLCRVGQSATGSPTGALVEVLTGTINYTLHAADATPGATTHTLEAGGLLELHAPHLFRVVRNGGSDATVRVTCFESADETRVVKAGGGGGAASSVQITDNTDTALVSGAGSLQVTCDNCGGASPFEDLDAFTAGTSSVVNIGGVFNDGLADVTSGQAAAPRITKDRGLHVNLRTNDGAETGVSAAPLRVDPTGTTTQPISAASLPLPTGAATAANQDGIVKDGAGDTTQANVSSGRLHVDGSGVTQPVSGTVTSIQGGAPWSVAGPAADGAAVSGNPVRIGGKDGSGNTQDIATDTSGELQVDVLSLPSVTIGTFPDNEPFNVAQWGGTTVLGGSGAVGTGSPRVALASGDGATWHSLISAASTNATNVKASAGTVYGLSVTNINAAVRYIRFYNLSSAPTCSSATGIAGRFAIPASATGAGQVVPIPPFGIAFSTGIGYCLTTGSGDTDNTAVAAGDLIVNVFYK